MRKRYPAALLAAVALAATGGLVYADTGTEPADPAAAATTRVITLPTGDRIRVAGDGALAPAPGDEDLRYFSPRLPGGDRIVIPHSARDDVDSGRLDARLFNVDALLRNGYTDARKVTSPKALGRSYRDGKVSDSRKAATEVTVSFAWLDGSVPKFSSGAWTNRDTGDFDYFETDTGEAKLKLPPGDYSFTLDMSREDDAGPTDLVGTVADLTVTDTAAELEVDGTKAKPMGFTVDDEAVDPVATDVTFFAKGLSGADKDMVGGNYLLGPETRIYAIPNEEISGHEAGFFIQSEMATPAGAAEPTSYHLFDVVSDGIPAEPGFTVHDDELARRNADYGSMGADAEMDRSNLAYNEAYAPVTYLSGGKVAVPSKRTEFYSASEKVQWSHLGTFVDPADEERLDEVMHDSGSVEPGTEDMPWLSGAAVSVGVSDPAFPYYGSGMERWPYSDEFELLTRPPMFTTNLPGETLLSWGLKGEAVLSKDGAQLGASTDGASVAAQLPADDAGRYTASFDGKRAAPWMPMGTHSTATWEFDSEPVEEGTILGLSAVGFTASGIEAGYAPVDEPQAVTLDYTTQPGAEDRACAGMTFQVSYDDGKTWSDVDIDREGDHATATLDHPKDATFVSVRFTAVDDLGQTVEHATIRSYGLN